MDITVYLPDEVGKQAKAAKLPLSQLLRAAVLEELRRREIYIGTSIRPAPWAMAITNDHSASLVGAIRASNNG